MKIHKIISFLPLLLIFVSCNKSAIDVQTSLCGKWQWVSTDGGIAGNIHETPASTGNAIILTLSESLEYSFETNNTVTNEGAYSVTRGTSIYDHQEKQVIQFHDLGDFMIESFDGSTLVLSDNALDGLKKVYHRIQSEMEE